VPEVPADLRGRFMAAYGNTGASGVNIGPGQAQGSGVTGQGGDLPQVVQAAHDVFVNAFVGALRPTIGVAVAVVVVAAVSCLFIRRTRIQPGGEAGAG